MDINLIKKIIHMNSPRAKLHAEIIDEYLNHELSVSEIASKVCMTRQGIHKILKKYNII